MTIEIAEALYYLDELPPESLGDLGVSLLEADLDTPAVRELAGLGRDATWRDVGDLFKRVLTELGRRPLTTAQAAYRIAESAARDIVAGRVSPYEGAAKIAYTAYHPAGMPDDLGPFYYWADEWEDNPEHREACERDIVANARAFLELRAQST
jgi:hypothetical protein